MIKRPLQFATLAAAMLATQGGVAQDLVSGLQVLEQGTADSSPLGVSLRVMHPGPATPLGFEQVYVLPGGNGKLMRASGGLYIVFDQSTYMNTAVGTIPMFPTDGHFFIGPPPELLAHAYPQREAIQRSPFQVNRQETTTAMHAVPYVEGPLPAPRSPHEERQDDDRRAVAVDRPGGPAIVTDELYRAARLKELLDRAAAKRRPA